jgi:hypothetical protein
MKIEVPEDMLNAAWEAVAVKMRRHIDEGQAGPVAELHIARIAVEATLAYIANNPSQPDEDQMDELVSRHSWLDKDSVRFGAREWQRIMFLEASQPAAPPEIADILATKPHTILPGDAVVDAYNNTLIEAFRRGFHARGQRGNP